MLISSSNSMLFPPRFAAASKQLPAAATPNSASSAPIRILITAAEERPNEQSHPASPSSETHVPAVLQRDGSPPHGSASAFATSPPSLPLPVPSPTSPSLPPPLPPQPPQPPQPPSLPSPPPLLPPPPLPPPSPLPSPPSLPSRPLSPPPQQQRESSPSQLRSQRPPLSRSDSELVASHGGMGAGEVTRPLLPPAERPMSLPTAGAIPASGAPRLTATLLRPVLPPCDADTYEPKDFPAALCSPPPPPPLPSSSPLPSISSRSTATINVALSGIERGDVCSAASPAERKQSCEAQSPRGMAEPPTATAKASAPAPLVGVALGGVSPVSPLLPQKGSTAPVTGVPAAGLADGFVRYRSIWDNSCRPCHRTHLSKTIKPSDHGTAPRPSAFMLPSRPTPSSPAFLPDFLQFAAPSASLPPRSRAPPWSPTRPPPRQCPHHPATMPSAPSRSACEPHGCRRRVPL